MDAYEKYLAVPGKKFRLSDYETSTDADKPDKDDLKEALQKDIREIDDLQYKLYAENRQSLLIVFQGMDASGKDSAIRHIMTGVSPQGVLVHSFKHPSTLELEHDFLWRHYQKLPEKGQIVIFNRSHYENVLIARVHPEIVLAEHLPGIDSLDQIDESFWEKRFGQINNFEHTLVQNGTLLLKFFLHLSKDEQRKRFLERLENKDKHWKFSYDDLKERAYWDAYQQAYEDAV